MGIKEAEGIPGYFFEFAYKVIVARTKVSENFKCFVGNEDQQFEYYQKIYCRNEASYLHILHFKSDVYSYVAQHTEKSDRITAEQIRQRIFTKETGFRLPYYNEILDYIL